MGRPAAYVAYGQWRNNPEPNVMRPGFVLMALYMGPFGLLPYVLADKEPRPGTHEEFVKPLAICQNVGRHAVFQSGQWCCPTRKISMTTRQKPKGTFCYPMPIVMTMKQNPRTTTPQNNR